MIQPSYGPLHVHILISLRSAQYVIPTATVCQGTVHPSLIASLVVYPGMLGITPVHKRKDIP